MSLPHSDTISVEQAIEMLETNSKPADLADTFILDDDPHELAITDLKNLNNLMPAQILFHQHRCAKKGPKPDMWNVDVAMGAPGYFDEAGNFVLNNSKKQSVLWYIKRGCLVEGPFSSNEILDKAKSNQLDGVEIKRDFDRGFVRADELLSVFPALNQPKEISKYFSKKLTEVENQADDFFSDVILKERTHGKRISKVTSYMQVNHISASAEFITKNIMGKKREEAILIIGRITGLAYAECGVLLGLLINESNKQILADVDSDGFTITNGRAKNWTGRHKRC